MPCSSKRWTEYGIRRSSGIHAPPTPHPRAAWAREGLAKADEFWSAEWAIDPINLRSLEKHEIYKTTNRSRSLCVAPLPIRPRPGTGQSQARCAGGRTISWQDSTSFPIPWLIRGGWEEQLIRDTNSFLLFFGKSLYSTWRRKGNWGRVGEQQAPMGTGCGSGPSNQGDDASPSLVSAWCGYTNSCPVSTRDCQRGLVLRGAEGCSFQNLPGT